MLNEKQRIIDDLGDNLKALEHELIDNITSISAEVCAANSSFISFSLLNEPKIIALHGINKPYALAIYSSLQSNKSAKISDASSKNEHPIDKNNFSLIKHKNLEPTWHLSLPLVTDEGLILGELHVLHPEEKWINETQFKILSKLSRQILFLVKVIIKETELTEQKLKLQNRIQTLEVIQDINKVGTWELDIQSGETIWSEMVYIIHEVPFDFDHNKINGIEFYQENYKEIILNAIQHAIENNTHFDVICELKSAKGNLKWVRSTGKRVDKKLIGSFQDITDLKQRELKFEGIFNSTIAFIGFLNRDGILLEANETALSVGGIERIDVIGKYFWDCHWWQISEHTRKQLKANFFKALSGEKIMYEVEINIANSQTTTILFSMRPVFDDNGNVIYIIPEGMPIDDLVKTRDRFKAVIEGTNAGTWEWDIEKGLTIYNEKWAEFLGYTLKELEPTTDQTWVSLAHPDDLAESARKLQSCF